MKQGCVLAPVMFNLFFTLVLLHAVKDLDVGIYIQYRSDGFVFDLRRLSAKTKILEKLILEALFADYCALTAPRRTSCRSLLTASQSLQGLCTDKQS